jgi:hypothetical protein
MLAGFVGKLSVSGFLQAIPLVMLDSLYRRLMNHITRLRTMLIKIHVVKGKYKEDCFPWNRKSPGSLPSQGTFPEKSRATPIAAMNRPITMNSLPTLVKSNISESPPEKLNTVTCG